MRGEWNETCSAAASATREDPGAVSADERELILDLELTGKRAIVTGGSRGIGKSIARELAREGADVVIAARGKDKLEATAAELSAETGRRVVPLVVDTGNETSVNALVERAVAALGGVDILVNNAALPGGISPATRLDQIEGIVTPSGTEPRRLNHRGTESADLCISLSVSPSVLSVPLWLNLSLSILPKALHSARRARLTSRATLPETVGGGVI